jgi:hypothetical protein
MARKPRLPTLPRASYSGSAPTFAPTDEQWRQIGGVYCDLSEDDRTAISEAVIRYFRDIPFEKHVCRNNEVQRHWEAIHKAACDFNKAAHGFYRALAPDAFGCAQVGDIALDELSIRLRSLGIGLEQVETIAASVMAATGTALREIDQDPTPGVVTHDAWYRLAQDVMAWAEHRSTRRLRVTISEKNKDSKNESPFVEFFSRLQDTFPSELRDFDHSGSSLANGLRTARDKRKRSTELRG